MIEGEPVEMTEVIVAVDTMPVAVFQTLWSGLSELREQYGDEDGAIARAQTWLNVTMQGREWEVLCEYMAANAPEPEPSYDYFEPEDEDWDKYEGPHWDTPGGY